MISCGFCSHFCYCKSWRFYVKVREGARMAIFKHFNQGSFNYDIIKHDTNSTWVTKKIAWCDMWFKQVLSFVLPVVPTHIDWYQFEYFRPNITDSENQRQKCQIPGLWGPWSLCDIRGPILISGWRSLIPLILLPLLLLKVGEALWVRKVQG